MMQAHRLPPQQLRDPAEPSASLGEAGSRRCPEQGALQPAERIGASGQLELGDLAGPAQKAEAPLDQHQPFPLPGLRTQEGWCYGVWSWPFCERRGPASGRGMEPHPAQLLRTERFRACRPGTEQLLAEEVWGLQ